MFDNDFFDEALSYQERRRREFERLACDPCLTEAKVGDRVLVSAGPVSRGFEWERLEAVVMEVADTAYKLLFVGRSKNGKDDIGWIHKFIVTDVLSFQEQLQTP
jgi:hypothetical protein